MNESIFDKLGVNNITLNINSIGCPECRAKYNEALKGFLKDNFDKLCFTCRERFDKNPLRILDCKEDSCKQLLKNAPKVLDYLCDSCREHHNAVCNGLQNLNIDFVVNPQIVRGLDYYTKTVFEFISNSPFVVVADITIWLSKLVEMLALLSALVWAWKGLF